MASVLVNGVMMIVAGAAEIGMGLHMKNWGRLILLCAAGALLLLARRLMRRSTRFLPPSR